MSDKLTLDGDWYDTFIKVESMVTDQWDKFNNCLAMYIKQQLPEEEVRKIYANWEEGHKKFKLGMDRKILKASRQPWIDIRDMSADLDLEDRTEDAPKKKRKTDTEILGPAKEVLEELGYNIATQFYWGSIDVCRYLDSEEKAPEADLVDLVYQERDKLVDLYLARAFVSLHNVETVGDEDEAYLEWHRVYDSIFHALNLNPNPDVAVSVNKVVDVNDKQKGVLNSLTNLIEGAKTARELYANEAFYMIMNKSLVDSAESAPN